MTRAAMQLVWQSQAVLPLDDAPGSADSLRAAYAATALPVLGITFDHAIANDAMRRCLENIKHARLKAAASCQMPDASRGPRP